MSNNNYPLDEKALEEQYADLLLKIALKEYLKEQAPADEAAGGRSRPRAAAGTEEQ